MIDGDWPTAEREYLVADTLFRGQSNQNMIRAVSSRRGLASLANGNTEAARAELLPYSTNGISAPHTGAAPCERYVTLSAGLNDAFDGSMEDPLDPSSKLAALMEARGQRSRKFDGGIAGADQVYAVSFPLPAVRFCSAQVSYRIRRSRTIAGADNDAIMIGMAPFPTPGISHMNNYLWAANPSAVELEASIDVSPDILANAQRAYSGQATAFLDIFAGDDTDFDYIKLVLVY